MNREQHEQVAGHMCDLQHLEYQEPGKCEMLEDGKSTRDGIRQAGSLCHDLDIQY
jgi:hypothetical protein